MANIINVVNLTPHSITFIKGDEKFVVPASGQLARCASKTVTTGTIQTPIGEIPMTKTEMGEVEGLPDPTPGTVFIVSMIVAKAVPSRSGKDVFIPNESIRDQEGNIIGCKSFGEV